jgi:uncharacterized protein YbjT (DUF2867 family)
MRIAVAGGTGLTGAHVVTELAARGHQPVVLARGTGVDLRSGSGLDERLAGVDAVIDVTNVVTSKEPEAVGFFDAVGHNLLAAEQRCGVGHHVALSIIGIDRVRYSYYRGKLRQEEVIASSGLPATIIRAAQFHEFAGQILDRTALGPVVVAPRIRSQPIAVREVAAHLVAAAVARAGEAPRELAGPRVEELTSMIRQLIAAARRRRLIVPVRIPGAAGAAMARGALLPTGEVTLGGQDFATWLASEDAEPWLERRS